MAQRRSILIVGAGIAGLTAARALQRDGHEVRIVEQSPTFDAVGAGIVLQGNALAVLDAIGLGDAVRSVGNRTRNGGIFASDGSALLLVDERDVAPFPLTRDMATYFRPDLHACLSEGTDCARHLGTRPTIIEETADGVKVELDDGWSGVVDLLVGADGIHSAVRATVYGESGPSTRYAGYVCWRVVADNRIGAKTVSETWGRGLRVGLVPLTHGRIYSFFVANTAPGGADDPTRPAHLQLQERFSSFEGEAGRFIESLTEADTVMRHDIDELDRVVWGRGRVVLIGDAAHAMTPNMGQGAAQGIEDAIGLAAVLRQNNDVRNVATSLAVLRDQRVRQVKDRSRTIGAVGQWQNALACWLRNTGTRLTPSGPSLSAIEAVLRPGVELVHRLDAAV